MSRIVYARNLRKKLKGSAQFAPVYRNTKTILPLLCLNLLLVSLVSWQYMKPSSLPLLPQASAHAMPQAYRSESSTGLSGGVPERVLPPQQIEEQRIAQFIRSKYHIANEAAQLIVTSAYASAKLQAIDPLLLISIIGVESGFNPIAESSAGAKGLSQPLAEAHPEKINKLLAESGNHILNISDNIELGAKIYAEYHRKFNGNTVKALLQYNGSLSDRSESYAKKVMAFRSRLMAATKGT